MKSLFASASTLALMGMASCGGEPEQVAGQPREADATLLVYATSYPVAYFAQRIGGESVEIVFPAPPGVDPAHWSPAPEVVAKYQQADLILRSGAGYESWLHLASLPRAKLVDTAAALGDRLISLEGVATHQHGPEGAHTHEGMAFTLWLDPMLAGEQARTIAKAFAQARPGDAAGFAARLADLEADLAALDAELAAAVRRLKSPAVIFSHPVYQYFARRYGLDGQSLEWEPDEPPSAEQWSALESLLARHPAELMIWEAAPLGETRARLATLGIEVAVFEPLGNRPQQADWLEAMRRNARALVVSPAADS